MIGAGGRRVGATSSRRQSWTRHVLDATLTADQTLLARSVREFAERELRPNVRAWDDAQRFPHELLPKLAELGLMGIQIPEAYGGAGMSALDYCLALEELARVDPSIALSVAAHNGLGTAHLAMFGSEAQKQRYVVPLAQGRTLAAWGLTEAGSGSDAAAMRTTAVRDADGWVLNGVKQFISGAGSSSYYIVMARTADTGNRGITAIVVPSDTPGLSFGPNEKKMGWNAQPTRQVIFDNVRVPIANRLGEEGSGFGIAMKGLNGGRINMGACSLGGGQAALDKSVAYLKEREAFGGPLINQQSLLFQLADMETELVTARTLLWRAADALDRGAPDAVKLCAMAKRVATDAGFNVANSAIQLHGGYGYLSEYGLEKIARDLRVHQILEGSNEIMRLIIGRIVAGT